MSTTNGSVSHLSATLSPMPTKHPRIAVTRDAELDEALESVAPFVGPVRPARLVHDLAIRGAEALVEDEAPRREALARLARLRETDLVDWDVLARIDREAWGYEFEDE